MAFVRMLRDPLGWGENCASGPPIGTASVAAATRGSSAYSDKWEIRAKPALLRQRSGGQIACTIRVVDQIGPDAARLFFQDVT